MRKVILFNMVTLDGFFEGPNGEIDWHKVDDEFNEFAIQQTGSAAGLIFGRKTYELMVSYWPTPQAETDDPQVTEIMNSIPKYVFSRTLEEAGWKNTRLIKEDAPAEIQKLKAEPGGDLFIFGSANLSASLLQKGLIDEIRVIVNPVVLGDGRTLFEDLPGKLELELLNSRAFRSGNVLLYYRPKEIRVPGETV
jgi:dihydrofolate reductase